MREMEERYDLLARTGVRSITEFNSLISQEQAGENMPYIVVIIDELADLMMVASRDVEPPSQGWHRWQGLWEYIWWWPPSAPRWM